MTKKNKIVRSLFCLITNNLVLFLFQFNATAQSAGNYSFATNTNGSLSLDKNGNTIDMSAGTTQLYGPNTDSYTAVLQSMGFGFTFMGATYTSFSANPDGQVRLGAVITGPLQNATLNVPCLFPVNYNTKVSSIGKVHFKVQGSTPNSLLVVEWKDIIIPFDGTANSTYSTFQMRLYENGGAIEYVFGTMYNTSSSFTLFGTGFSSGNTSGKIGIVTGIPTSPVYNSTTTNFTANTYAANSELINLNSSTESNRRKFLFTPPVVVSPTNLSFPVVGAGSVTLSWSDNMSGELGYKIFQSTDGINYSLVSTTAADVTTYTQTGLNSSTLYYWKVITFSEGGIGTELIGSVTTQPCSISGLKTIPGDYPSITAAIVALQNNGITGPVILEIQPSYIPTSESVPLALPFINCSDPANTITIRPAAGTLNTGFTTFNSGSSIEINGGNYWIIDGRPGGVGITSQLTFSNVSGSATSSAIKFVNNASNNIVKYVNLSGTAQSSSSGVVVFSTTNSTGNSNNLIDHCNINGNASTIPATANISSHGIYSSGTAAFPNINNTVSNCNIFDMHSPSTVSTTSGINLLTGNSDWIIDGNSFYQTGSRTGNSAGVSVNPINIINTSGNNFIITNNFIGGSAPACTGTPWIQSGNGATFTGINLSVGSSVTSSIQGNRISNIEFTTGRSDSWIGIGVNGNANIGNVNGNIIGSNSGLASIIVNETGSPATSRGIYGPGITGILNVSNNTIGAIELRSTSTSISHGFVGILLGSISSVVQNNIIGGNQPNNIYASNPSTTSTIQSLVGISVTTNGIFNVSNNIVSGLTNNYNPTTASPNNSTAGIITQNYGTVNGNTIHDLYGTSNGNGIASNASVIGIKTNTANNVSGNYIHSIKNSNSSQAVHVVGLSISGLSQMTISKNRIHDIAAASPLATIHGIYAGGGANFTYNFINNMISLGLDTLGNSLSVPTTIYGINDISGENNYYHNTVFIGGTSVLNSSNNTFAFNNSNVSDREFINNIFVNKRSNSTTGGKHYSIQVAGTVPNPPGLTMDYNIYFSQGNGGVMGRFNSIDVFDTTSWRNATGKDLLCKNEDPCLADPSAGFPDLHLTNCGGPGNPAESAGYFIHLAADDFDGEIRSQLTPVDIGADAQIANSISNPVLGNYQNVTVQAGANIMVSPDAMPSNVTGLKVIASPNFTGLLSADPITGNIFITNAKPSGVHTITVAANPFVTKTFTVTVNNGVCTNAGFTLSQTVNTGNAPMGIATGDFNKDGNTDFVVLNNVNNNASVFLGNGSASFVAGGNVSLDAGPLAIAVADMNGDGNQDLVTANFGASTVSVRLGDGLGGFSGSINRSVGTNPSSIIIADFNSDYIPDVAVPNANSQSVSVLFGDGTGNFLSFVNTLSTTSNPTSIAAADFNNDGRMDFITSNVANGSVSLRLQNSTGGFATSFISIGFFTSAVATGDFNNDGNQDFAVSSTTNTNISIKYGTGTGTFSGSSSVVGNTNPRMILNGDFNADGIDDLAIPLFSSNGLLLKTGTTFANPGVNATTGSNPYCIATADFNEDGKLDLVVANNGSNTVSILLGNNNEINVTGNGSNIPDGNTTASSIDNTNIGAIGECNSISKSFSIQNTGILPLNISSISFTGGNSSDFVLSGITLPAIVAVNGSVQFTVDFTPSAAGLRNTTVHITSDDCDEGDYNFLLEGNGLPVNIGSYPATTVLSGGNTVITPSSIPANTSYLSLSISTGYAGLIGIDKTTGKIQITNAKPAGVYTVNVYVGTCKNQTFTLTINNNTCNFSAFTSAVNINQGAGANFVTIADFNNDNNQDFIVTNNTANNATINLGNGNGGFTAAPSTGAGTQPTSVAVSDFNNDGKFDIAVAYFLQGSIAIRTGNGDGTFNTMAGVNVGFSASSIAAGDLNGDGNSDIVTADFGSSKIHIRYGNGQGGLTGSLSYNVSGNPNTVAINDINGDNRNDILVVVASTNSVRYYYNNGDGTFVFWSSSTVGNAPRSIALGDFNSDNKQDYVVANTNSSSLSLRLGDGTGSFISSTISVAASPNSVTTCDINSDGKLDLAVTHVNGSITTLLNNGSGGFTIFTTLTVGTNPVSIASGDFNNDGRYDLITANSGSANSSILLASINEINVRGNNVNIPDGSMTPSFTNNTNFGSIPINTSLTKDYVIQNTGSFPLTVTSISSTGTNATDFTLSGIILPVTIPAAGGSAGFSVSCLPSGSGTLNTTIHISSNDCDEGDYDFALQATGICIPLSFTTCPGNQNVTASLGLCRSTVNYTVATTGSPAPTITYDFTGATTGSGSGSGSGQVFNEGTTHVVVSALNLCSNVSCSFDIVVIGNPGDNNVCTIDACNSSTGLSTHTPVSTEDNNVCTSDGCDSNTGVFHNPVETDDHNACTTDGCNSSTGIFHNPVNTNDNNPCTTDGCDSNTGVFHNSIETDDLNACTTDGCNTSTGVFHNPVNTNDNNACTTDGCNSSTGNFHNPVNTDDGNACTTDGCNTLTGVFHNPVNTNDNNACTTDGCDSSTGIFHNPVNTDDGNSCTEDGCNTLTGIYHNPVSTDDHNACTNDACNTSTGVFHDLVNIDDSNACTIDGCDTNSGIFHFPILPDDGNACTTDYCNSIAGVLHDVIEYNDDNACTIDACDSNTGISHTPVNTDDNNACTTDACHSVDGISHTQVSIDDNDACTVDACHSISGVSHTPVIIDDDNVCTLDACHSITGISHTAIDIDDHNECTIDACHSIDGVSHTTVYIDDANSCTIDACDSVTGEITHTNNSPTLQITIDPVRCYGETTCINVEATGGIPPYFGTGQFCGYGAGDYFIDVIDDAGCIVTESVSVNEPTKLSIIVSSTPSTCSQSDGTASVTSIGGVLPHNYLWTPGLETTSTLSGLAPGDYTVTCTDANNCTASETVTVSTTGGAPTAPSVIHGPSGACRKQTGIVYCIDPVPTAVSYSWVLPAGASSSGPMNGSCITINFNSKYNGGYILVRAINACGMSPFTGLNVVKISKKPHTPGSIFGPSTICPLTTGNYFINPVLEASGYQWLVSGGLVIVSGQGTNSIVVNAQAGFIDGNIKVKAINCKGSSGNRTRRITKNTNCRTTEYIIAKDQIGKNDSELSSLSVFPNPTSDKIMVSFYTETNTKWIVKVSDLLGKVVILDEIISSKGFNSKKLEFGSLPKGIYLLYLQSNGISDIYSKKIIVE